jgi:isopentenyl-diphosphate delta-isomerase
MSEHSRRKGDHLDLCATDDVAFQQKTTLLDEVQLVHNALPELDVDAISLATTVAGFPVRAPVVISAMTGGVERAERINKSLAAAAQEAGFGSMRPLLEDSNALGYHVRDVAPTAVLFGNIGGVQAASASTQQIVDMIGTTGVNALCVHLNPAQEVVQGGGDTDFRGVVDALARLTSELDIPIIAKETGAGMSRQAGLKLHDAGVRHVDISGAGGTSWVAVETLRARAKTRALGERFWDWGIPTAASIAQIADLAFDTVIATGGIRHGLDIAKALALGATAGGMARPFLMAYNAGGEDAVREQIEQVTHEIRVACLLTGCASVQDLAHSPLVIDPALERWLPGGSSVRARLMHRYA